MGTKRAQVQRGDVSSKKNGALSVSAKKTKKRVSKKHASSRSLTLVEHTDTADIAVPINNKITKTPRTVLKRTETLPAIRSPYRLPMVRTETMALVTRVIGLCFIVTGALFSFLYADQASHTELSLLGKIHSAQLTQSSTTQLSPTVTNQIEPVFALPPLSIQISLPTGTVRGIVPVTVQSPAESVHLYALGQNSSRIKLGSAVQTDTPSVWRYEWDTKRIMDGVYSIEVVAQRGNEVKHMRFETPVTVKNTAETTTTNTTQTTSVSTETVPGTGTISDTSIVDDTASDANMNDNGSIAPKDVSIVTTETIKTEPVSTTPIPTNTDPAPTPVLIPDIKMVFSQEQPFAGIVNVYVMTQGAQKVLLYVVPTNGLAERFVGSAKKISDTQWIMNWNTGETPNGEYMLVARVTTLHGDIDSPRARIRIVNEAQYVQTPAEKEIVETLQEAHDALIKPVLDTALPPPSNGTGTSGISAQPENTKVIESPASFIETTTFDPSTQEAVLPVLNEFKSELDIRMNKLGEALRFSDEEKIRIARSEIEATKERIRSELGNALKPEEREQVEEYVDSVTNELREVTERNVTILKERAGVAVHTDSDGDGISDYDEIHLYKTDPFSADTDGDGFIDGAEITNGFNPVSAEGEALIAYESPRDTGLVREDVLEVHAVSTIPPEDAAVEANAVPQALFAGKGLPNSFVTLYIFSTPIVVTVKTDAEGNWSYILDKDLEDGEHEIYVGITDNTGRIVAKSNPLPFVKTAEAYTGVERAVPIQEETYEPSFFTAYGVALAASTLIVTIGLVLVLIGTFVHPRREDELLKMPTA